MENQKLYKIDSNGNTRVWWMEYDKKKYRTHSGIEGGKIVVSGWQYPEAKNVGRANETTVAEQVVAEAMTAIPVVRRRRQRDVDVAEFEVGARRGPHVGGAGVLGRIALPGVVPHLTRVRNDMEGPQQLAAADVVATDIARRPGLQLERGQRSGCRLLQRRDEP